MKFYRLPLFLLVILAAFAATGCTTAKTRGAATSAVTEMRTTAENRETQYRDYIKGLLRQVLDSRREILRERFKAEQADLVSQIYDRFAIEQSRESENFRQQIRDQIKPVRERLESGINSENALLANGSGSREKQQALALQLATTLAITQNRTEQALDDITNEIREKREAAIKTVRAITPPAELSPDSTAAEAEVTALLAELDRSTADYKSKMKEAENALHNFIETTYPEKMAGEFFKGLLGPAAGGFIAEKLQPKFQALENALTQKLDSLKTTANAAMPTP